MALMGTKQIKDSATKQQELNGVKHRYVSLEYAARKGKGTAGHGQKISSVKKTIKRAKGGGKSQTARTPSTSSGGLKSGGKLGHNTQNVYVDMWLTGTLWDSLGYIRSKKLRTGTDVLFGFTDTELTRNKLKQAENFGREVLALTDAQADKVAEHFVRVKGKELISSFPNKITVNVGAR